MGRKEGRKEAREEGKIKLKQQCLEIAKNLLKLNMPISQISEVTKLPEEEIEKIILEYIRNRKKETSFMFPNIIETIIYLRIAEKFSCVERQIFWIEKAKYNSSNNPKVLKIILEDSTISEKIDAICEYM